MNDPQSGSSGNTPDIVVQSLTKVFKGLDHPAVEDLSFQVSRGEIIGLAEENGAGKSTLLRMLATIIKPTTGRAEVADFYTQAFPGANSFNTGRNRQSP